MSQPRKEEEALMLEARKQEDQLCEEAPRLFTWLLTFFSILLVVLTAPLSLLCVLKVVQEYEKVVIFRLGRILGGGERGPGIFFILPCTDKYEIVDMRVQNFSVPPQEMITRDSVTVYVNAIMYYRVDDAVKAVINVDDYRSSAHALAATTLRNVLGTRSLGEILSDRVTIATEIYSLLVEGTNNWGVTVERVEVKEVRVPEQLVAAMAAEAQAARDARGKVITAEGEHKASRALRHAADVLAENPLAVQLRYLQSLEAIAEVNNSTIIFPVPVDVLSRLIPPVPPPAPTHQE